MSCADSITKLLVDAHFTNCFTKVGPSVLDCDDPIVVLDGAFRRKSRQVEEERGTVVVTVLAVREGAAEAESVALAAERAVRAMSWEPYAGAGAFRIVGIDTTAPVLKERDSSGRFVWSFEATCTVVRAT